MRIASRRVLMHFARMSNKGYFAGLALLLTGSMALAWQHEYTFPDNQFSAIAFNGAGYLCMQDLSVAATSADLQTWVVSTNLSIPAEIREAGDPNDTVWLSLNDITAIDNKFLLALQRSVQLGQMGNMYLNETVSLLSTNGITWADSSSVYGGFGTLLSFPTFLLGINVWQASGWVPIGSSIYCDFYIYNPLSNQWSRTLQIYAFPDGQQGFFQDEQCAFFSFRGTNGYPRQILCTSNGVDYRVIDGGPETAEPSAAHDGQIICESQIYTAGKGWEASSFPDIRDLKFNGNRLVGRRESSLVYSDDFGTTWSATPIPDLSSAKIIEANGRYVALLNMQSTNGTYTAIYSIEADPARTSVTEIGNITAENQQLRFSAASNSLYQIESSTNLCGGVWRSYGLPFAGAGTNVTVNIPTNAAQTLFFKVKAINP